MTHRPLLRVFMNGGVIAPADLVRVMDASEEAGNDHILFSARQDILIPATGKGLRAASDVLCDAGLPFAPTSLQRLNEPHTPRNIVSSYAAVNVVETTWWLTEDVYHYTLANFTEQPRIKVHLVDPAQSLVPLFGGQVHFVASSLEQYWHLYLRGGDRPERVARRPGLIHGDDLPRVVGALEQRIVAAPAATVAELMELVPTGSWIADHDAVREPRPCDARFPYYEGLNAMANGQQWLGLYWRNNRFDIPFLRAACELCRDTKVGKISLTPWKSFIIKGIRPGDRSRWEGLMGTFGINMRHSSLELNWHIPVLDEAALQLKNDLVRALTMRDISTDGLTFTIQSTTHTASFTSVVIERERPGIPGSKTYTIRHAREFDPRHQKYVTFAAGLVRDEIPSKLIELTRSYWGRGAAAGAPEVRTEVEERPAELMSPAGHQCATCLTVYDAAFGDVQAGIGPGVPFEALPDDYACPVCAGGPDGFVPFLLSAHPAART